MKTSLGLIIAVCLAGLQFVAVIIVVSLSYLSSERVLLDHARSLLSDVGANTAVHSQGFLSPAQEAAKLAARLAENRIVASENQPLLEQLLFQQLKATPQFAGVFYGDEDGNFVYVMRSTGPGPFRSKIVSRDGEDKSTDLIWRTDNFAIVEEQPDPTDTYDPRTRPWYRLAQEQRSTAWTDPYIFFSSQTPGITIAEPVISSTGELRGVIGVDIEISAISDFLSDLEISENGAALIVNRNGDVIAHPNPSLLKEANRDGTFRFAGIDEIDDPIARQAFGDLTKMESVFVETETYREFSYDGADFVSTIVPTISQDLPWTIAVYAPETDFVGAIVENRSRDTWIAALVAALTGLIGLALANYINRPVRAFAVRAALISQGELDPTTPMPKTYKELEKANDTLTDEILRRKTTEHEYGQTFEMSSRGMIQVSPDTGQFVRANKKFADMMGYSVDEVLQMNADDLLVPDAETTFQQLVSNSLTSGTSGVKQRCIRKDGSVIWIVANAILIRDNAGKPLHAVCTVDDITQNKDAQAQIRKLNKDLSHLARGELLGQMAAGLAHELNQPLTAITQNADTALLTARDELNENHELIQILQDLDQQAHRAADTIKALRNFAKKGEELRAPFDLDQLIGQTLPLVQADATEHNVRINVELHDLPELYGIRVQIAQVLVNLLRNAIEAITIGGDNKKTIQIEAVDEKGFVQVSVSDSGPGVDPNIELFTQFETTKANGMGLGLSICRSIIETGGGKMWYETNEDQGARFCFTVPTVRQT